MYNYTPQGEHTRACIVIVVVATIPSTYRKASAFNRKPELLESGAAAAFGRHALPHNTDSSLLHAIVSRYHGRKNSQTRREMIYHKMTCFFMGACLL